MLDENLRLAVKIRSVTQQELDHVGFAKEARCVERRVTSLHNMRVSSQ